MAARYRIFSVRVAAVTSLTPHFVRVTLTGDALAEFSAVGLDQRIKVMLPIEGHGFTELPEDGDWYGAWRDLPDAVRNPLRTYTVRSFRPDAHELDIDFVAHGDAGPASRWVSGCRVGDELRIIGPRVPESPDELPTGAAEFAPGTATRILLAGDETAAPPSAPSSRRSTSRPSGTSSSRCRPTPTACRSPRRPGSRSAGSPGTAPPTVCG